MVNILRMDLYRLLRSKSLWICLGITVALAAMTIGVLGLLTNADFMQWAQSSGATVSSASNSVVNIGVNGNSTMSTEEITQSIVQAQEAISSSSLLTMTGTTLVNGNALAIMFTIFLSIFLASEFESGYSKNVFTVQPNRIAFLGARLVEIVLTAALFTAVSLASVALVGAIAGLSFAPTSAADLLLWGTLVTLVLSGFGMAIALIIWLTRKVAAGIIGDVVLVTGMLVMMVQALLSLFPALSHLSDFTLYACMSALGRGLYVDGGLSVAHIAGVGLAFVIVYAALSAVALKKKDI